MGHHIRFSQDDARQFAAWSGDRNPLHVDPAAARRSVFGQPVIHGMLTTIRALAAAATRPITSLDVEFRQAVHPDLTYSLETAKDPSSDTLTLRTGREAIAVVRINGDVDVVRPADAPWIHQARRQRTTLPGVRNEPAALDQDDLLATRELVAAYQTTAVPAGYLENGRLLPVQARVLALCSYVIGMEMPGLRSLFTRLRVTFSGSGEDSPELLYRARTVRFDRQFRLLDVQLDVVTPEGVAVAAADLRAYVRFTPLLIAPETTALHLSASTKRMSGQVALVVGGTRGLGGELAAALAMTGSHVYASYHADGQAVEELEHALPDAGVSVEFLKGDAADRSWCEAAVARIVARHGRLDLLILNACAAPAPLRVESGNADAFIDYVAANLRAVQMPLAAALPALASSSGTVAAISSSFVTEQPTGFGHYVALKEAVESAIRTTVREAAGVRAVIARPPRLQTTWNDTPTGVLGTIGARDAAVRIVDCLAREDRTAVELLTEFPPLATRPSARPTPDAPPAAPEFVVSLSASFTAEPLVAGLEFWLKELGVNGEVRLAPYGQILQTLLNPTAGVTGMPGSNLVMLRVRDWLRELRADDAASADFLTSYLASTAGDFERAMRTHRGHAGAETILVLCPSAAPGADAAEALIDRTEQDLIERLDGLPGLTIVRARDYHARYEVHDDQIADHVREHIAHIPYQPSYFHTLATLAMRHVHRKLSPRRKLVAVDCDNTLWGGVVGEAGPEGITFDAGHRALHETLTRLADSGVLVALCSKNEEADVWRVFDTRGDLGLRREQIVTAAINWQPKSANLRGLADKLNLGLDSFIFIDDNPVECAEVRSACPQVLTLQWPTDPERAIRLLQHTWELDVRDTTAEDRRRTELYKEEFRRQELQTQTLTFRDFIASLELVVDVSPLAPEDLKRASQLTLRTNQFNFTTRRRDEAEMQALVSAGTHEIRTVKVRDRFGDYGLVGLLIAERREHELFADTFLLSCRVLGRGVEHRMAAELGRIASEGGATIVRMRVEPTKRNTPARSFLQSIAPAEFRRDQGEIIEVELPVAVASAIEFQPPDQAPISIAEDDGKAKSGSTDASRTRSREEQIERSAFELATPEGLVRAIDGGSAPAATSTVSAPDTSFVYEAFAKALGVDAGRVKKIDSLEALGCDSFKIVEITVSLLEKWPQLPGTLLFEHRTVSDIARHIGDLFAPSAAPAPDAIARVTPAGTDGTTGDIAVVGMHLRCAGANSPDELWTLLSGGDVAVGPVPAERPYFLGRLEDERPHFAGLIDDIDRFDAELFGITPREAALMDPQLRLFLEVAWGALEDAGLLGEDIDHETGVFAGVMYGDYAYRANLVAKEAENPFKCWEGFSLANRLSQVFGFRGPSIAVDTACSSSATAVHLACRALAAGDCRVAIAGGVNLILDPDRFVQLGRLGILSMSGRCLAFGADADGTVLGEGAGVVVLRRLEDAVRRGDRIYGVIKATGVSTGSGSVGFTAPNPVAQSEAIRRALAAGHIDPRTIGYVETHGTGTALGDPIEVRGLMLAYGDAGSWHQDLQLTHTCSIGSIKPNIGHLEAGAGVMGLIKLLMQLQRGQLLPSVTSERLNPQIPFDETPFSVQRSLTRWERPQASVSGTTVAIPRRGALNSFGVGGANAHVIVEEPPVVAVADPELARPVHIMALSARSSDGLQRRARDLADLLARSSESAVDDLCFSINTAQRPLPHRAAITARTREEMTRLLTALSEGEEPAGIVRGTLPRGGAAPEVAFLFTGQGSQWPGMGRDLYATNPVFRSALDRCFALFDSLLGDDDLKASMFAEEGTEAAARLHQTALTQPALFSLGYALSELWRSWGITPAVVLGHSIGELTAMCVAGGLSLEDAARMVAARGRLMQALPSSGAMTSLMTDEASVAARIAGLEDRVAIAAINAPGQVVISGEAAAVNAIAEQFAAEGVKTRSLVVSHAFHSPLMQPMLAEYEAVLGGIRFQRPHTTFVSSVLGRVADEELLDRQYWLRNVTDPVRFTDGIRAVDGLGITTCLEMGPQPVLAGLGRQTLAGLDEGERLWLPSLKKDPAAWPTLLSSVGQLFVAGGRIDWRRFDAPYARRRVSLPPYPFGGKRHWIGTVPTTSIVSARTSGPGADEDGVQAYEIVWRTQAAPHLQTVKTAAHWAVIAGGGDTAATLARTLERTGATCTTLSHEAGDIDAQLKSASARNHLHGVIYLPGTGADGDAAAAARSYGERALEIMRGVASLDGSAGPALWIVTRQAVRTSSIDDGRLDVAQSVVWGMGRTFALEHPDRWGGLIDLPASYDAEAAANAIEAELRADAADDQVAIRRDGRFVPRLVRKSDAPVEGPVISSDRTYIVTGGLGALGLHTARWLVARGAKHVLLTSRRGATPENAAAVRELEAKGASVRVVAADVSTPAGVDVILAAVPAEAPLAGIFHAAGIDDTTSILHTTPGDAERVMSAKVSGAWLLHERTRDLRLDAFVCFSSIASVLGSATRAAYAGANAFLDALAQERRRANLPAVSINWGPWGGGGMATDTALQQYARVGNHALAPETALAVMDRCVGGAAAQVMIADIDWEAFRTAYEARRVRPLVAELRHAETSTPAKTEPAHGTAPWLDRLAGVPPDLRLAELTSMLQLEVAQTLGLDGADDVAPDQVFREIGMDSLMAAEFAHRLQKRIGVKSTAMVFDHPTVSRLAAHLLEKLAPSAAASVAVPEPAVAVAAAGAAVRTGEPSLDGDALSMYFSSEKEPPSRPVEPVEGENGRTERYSAAVEPDVFAFQKEAYPRRREDLIAPRWQWMFVESARRLRVTPQVWLHRHGGRIVGHNGAIPVRLQIAGEECLTGWLVDTMVLPEYRDQAVGARLMVEAHEDMPLALSLGQTEQMRAIQFRLGWHQVAPLQTAQLLIRPERVFKGKLPAPAALAAGFALRAGTALRDVMKGKGHGWVREVASFDESHDRLWDACSRELRCAVRRDASYLNWKYVDQPGQDFLRLEMRTAAGARGVIVLMLRDPDDAYQYRRAFIVDLVAPLSNDEFMADLLVMATRAAAERGADALLCLHISRRLTECLQRAGFRMREPSRYLLVRPETIDDRLRQQLLDPDAWFVTQGDSDIDRPW